MKLVHVGFLFCAWLLWSGHPAHAAMQPPKELWALTARRWMANPAHTSHHLRPQSLSGNPTFELVISTVLFNGGPRKVLENTSCFWLAPAMGPNLRTKRHGYSMV